MTAAKLIDDPEALGANGPVVADPGSVFETTGIPTVDALLDQIRWRLPNKKALRDHYQRVASRQTVAELQSLSAVLAAIAMVVLIDLTEAENNQQAK